MYCNTFSNNFTRNYPRSEDHTLTSIFTYKYTLTQSPLLGTQFQWQRIIHHFTNFGLCKKCVLNVVVPIGKSLVNLYHTSAISLYIEILNNMYFKLRFIWLKLFVTCACNLEMDKSLYCFKT